MPDRAIIDTSVLIAFDKLRLTMLLCELYCEIILPQAVIDEFGAPNLACSSARRPGGPLVNLLVQEVGLGEGESEVIALGVELGARVVIDDMKARKVAESLGLNVTGTMGLLLKAELRGFISSALDQAKRLKQLGFYVSDTLLRELTARRK